MGLYPFLFIFRFFFFAEKKIKHTPFCGVLSIPSVFFFVEKKIKHINLFLPLCLSAMTTLLASSAMVCFPKPNNSDRIHMGISAAAASSSRLSLTKTKVSELGFVTSQLGGLKISNDHSISLKSLSSASPQPAFQPIIARNLSSL